MTNDQWLVANNWTRDDGGKLISPAGDSAKHLTAAETAELLPNERDPALIGNRIEAAIKRLGIPPCSGCGSRRDWLNGAHAYFRELTAVVTG